MRKEIFRMPDADAYALLARLPHIQLASTGREGEPILRTLDFALLDDAIVFHGAPAGEKLGIEGRPAVVAASETVAKIPSYFVDPERACPATTLYRSVQVHGVVERVDDARTKTRVLDALMRKYQPEGGHRPLDDEAMYAKAIAGVLVMRMPIAGIDGKAKLGQNRTPPERAKMCVGLWRRGAAGDVAAIEAVREASGGDLAIPFLAAPAGARLVAQCDSRDEGAMLDLLRGQYWNRDVTDAGLLRAHRGSSAWVGARDANGRLIATARALADGAKFANIYDVAVDPVWRGRGVGDATVRLLLDHPAVRGAKRMWLRTRDAEAFYARMGFAVSLRRDVPGYGAVVEMIKETPAEPVATIDSREDRR
jgi:nitroimidazol reductase NimA-like FMN-containing flavoprotein (pyridoxamine 5'-phosphate oxidase superfamily)/N-acetylglutamate synthase-like GNAT family acetyltransferase